MSNNSRERKVRGSQIRSSRSEKSDRDTGDRTSKQAKRLKQQQTTTGGATRQVDDPVTSNQSFVSTDAVDRMEQRVTRWLNVNRPVHLVGPTGCGKTALAVHVAEQRDRPTVWINGDADLTTSDLVGEFAETERISERDKYIHNVIKSKDIVRDRWVDNPLTVAVREGATLVYNEFSRTKPVANNVLLSVFEEGVLELPGQRGESRYVDVHPEFRAVLTSNSVEYAGVHEPQDALLDRLVGLHMGFYDFETELQIVHANLNGEDNAESIVRLMRELREALEITVGTRAAIMAAEAIAAADDPDHETLTDICVEVLASKIPRREDVRDLRRTVATTVEETIDTPA